MHGTPFSRITILFAACTVLLCQGLFGQKNAAAEVSVVKCWSYPLADVLGEQIGADESGVFWGLNGARIEALTRDGKKIWSSEFGGDLRSNILITETNLFFVTSAVSGPSVEIGPKLRWVSKDTGVTNWNVTLPNADRHYLGLSNGSVIVVSNNGAINSIDVRSGSIKWKRQIAEGFVGEPSFTASSVTLATTGKHIFDVSLKSGELNSMRKFPFAVTALSAAENGVLIVGDERGNVSALDGSNRPIWKFKTGGEISKILDFNGNILAASHDNFVYFLSARNGGRIWKKRLAGRIEQIATVSDRFALISTFEERSAVLTDLMNGRVAGRISFDENENLTARPIATNGHIFLITNAAVYSYSLSGCPPEK